jgi:NDP-sugar pyrophosphorylase family protein
MKAMIFAAGLGTRLKEETKNKPKALVEIGGKPLLQHAIEKLKYEGISEIVINVHHFSTMIVSFINNHNFGIPVKISDETDKLLDTGGGLKKASSLLGGKEPVVIYNVDILSNINIKKVIREHLRHRALVTLIVRKRKSPRCFKFDDEKNLVAWINKKSGEIKISNRENLQDAIEMSFSGIHIVSPEIFSFMPVKERFSIIDFYIELAKKNPVKGFFDDSELWMDAGTPHKLEEARRLMPKFEQRAGKLFKIRLPGMEKFNQSNDANPEYL